VYHSFYLQGSHARHVAKEANQEEIMDVSYFSLSRKLLNIPFKAHNQCDPVYKSHKPEEIIVFLNSICINDKL